MEQEKNKVSTYFSARALQSMRSSGYRDTTYALAELIDNSFDGSATKTKIIFFEKRDNSKRRYIDEIIVCDNGDGMQKEVLHECLTFGATTNTDLNTMVSQKKKGKFGFGLPNASLSQCKLITAYSWQKSGQVFCTTLDLGNALDNNSIDLPDIKSVPLPSHYAQADAILNKDHGVIISWKECDRLSAIKGETLCDHALPVLGQLYRYLLVKGSSIELEVYEYNSGKNTFARQYKKNVVPNDPLFLMSDTCIAKDLNEAATKSMAYSDFYKRFSTGAATCKPTNIRHDDSCQIVRFEWQGKIYKLEIMASYAHIDIQKPGIKIGANTDVGRFYGKRDSISFVRADREIATGDFGFYKRTEPQHRWWSIEVRFDADLDDLLDVYNTKQGVNFKYTNTPPDFDEITASLPQARAQFWSELSNTLTGIYNVLFKQVRKQGREWDVKNESIPGSDTGTDEIQGSTTDTEGALIKTDGPRASAFSDEELKALAQRLGEKFPGVSAASISNAIAQFNKTRAKSVVLYQASADQSLWTMTAVSGILITLINTTHSFYENIMAPLRTLKTEQALAAIELFISSLASEETGPDFQAPDKRNVLEDFRVNVSVHLNRYIRDNSISFQAEAEEQG